jgi:hypothetical protein
VIGVSFTTVALDGIEVSWFCNGNELINAVLYEIVVKGVELGLQI